MMGGYLIAAMSHSRAPSDFSVGLVLAGNFCLSKFLFRYQAAYDGW